MKIGKKTFVHAQIYKSWNTAKSGDIKCFNVDIFLLPTIEFGYNCDNFSSIRKSLEIHFRFLLLNLCLCFDKYE
jgi:hypothetical protein